MITVASVPTGHRYVAHLAAGDSRVRRLPDPVPEGAGSSDRWWPPRWLEPAWLSDHIDDFDVLHLHFGFDSISPGRLHQVVDLLHHHNKPLVFTAHDLHNPHFRDNTLHLEQLNVLVRGADEVITLTPGAATEIVQRWGVEATVIPHPHVAPLGMIGRPRGHGPEFVVGVHAKSLRANLDPLAILDTIVTSAAGIPDTRARVDLDSHVFDPGGDQQTADLAAIITDYATGHNVDLRIHDRFDDNELWQYLTEIDVSVLPYRFGTHSGWLEACYDLGTAVIAPDCGYFGDQKPCRTYGFGLDRFDPSSLTEALRATHAERDSTPAASRASREIERQRISAMHDAVYSRALEQYSTATGRADQAID
ncbi:glycosyltransferase involved in cell wall biosynthesis [Williamsia muralis]|uniref:Glycosyltransferase involved in cell wall biosynthesis n=1 Tax=Williamsia marianensis TaxID=85044 RepID=A0A495K1S2_WILMA|nr:glycosyltransferase [Williamsia muralis]RKR95131.1 glycosyltransferase involved in cell wall biosynthesis [Williamsia muralis]